MSERTYYSQEAELRAKRQTLATAGLVLVLGVGVGAVLAMLFAPKIEEYAGEAGHALNKGMKSGSKHARHMVSKLSDEVGDLSKQASKIVSKGTHNGYETAEEMLDRIEGEVKSLRKSIRKQLA
jgi:gas vesicle protein